MTIFTGKKKVDSGERNQLLQNYWSKFIYLFIYFLLFIYLFIYFCRGHPVVFMKIRQQNSSWFQSNTTKYLLCFYFDDMLRSTDLHQATFRKLRIMYMQCKSCNVGSHTNAICTECTLF